MSQSASDHLGSIDVVIVNWNSNQYLRECLQSFVSVRNDAVRLNAVTVVDNASTDHSADGLEALAPELPLRIIRNEKNRGFGAACNQGAKGSTADYVLFLNPDTRLLAKSLEVPARFLAKPSNTEAGIVGVQMVDDKGNVAITCARFPSPMSMVGQSLGLDRLGIPLFPPHYMKAWKHDEARQVDQVMGAFFFVRRSLFERLAGFDERFFVYYEDLDFSLRAKSAGFTSVYLANAQVYHKGQGTTSKIVDRRLFYVNRSRTLYALKHFSAPAAFVTISVMLVMEPLTRFVAAFFSRVNSPWAVLRGYRMIWADVPGIFKTASGSTDDKGSASDAL